MAAFICPAIRCLPLEAEGGRLRVAMADPTDAATLEAVRAWTGLEADPVVGEEADVLEAIERLHGSGSTTVQKIIEDMGGGDGEVLSGPAEEDAEHLKDLASEAPVIRLVNLIITRAAESGARDIHFEPFEHEFRIRLKADGVLQEMVPPPKHLAFAITTRIKVMANLDIAERRLPQDGRIKMKMGPKKAIDFRVSVLPCLFGEKIVMRLLDKSNLQLDMTKLGFGTAPRPAPGAAGAGAGLAAAGPAARGRPGPQPLGRGLPRRAGPLRRPALGGPAAPRSGAVPVVGGALRGPRAGPTSSWTSCRW